MTALILASTLACSAPAWSQAVAGPSATTPVYDVRKYGAKGDGRTIDSSAINQAIAAAAAAGGGTVYLPAGTYLSFSIRLKSHITLAIGAGATLLAADPADGRGRYDAPEDNAWDMYQDFGHSHWQNSLIWGIGLEDVAIVGPGRIDGQGLTRQGPGPRRIEQDKPGDVPVTLGSEASAKAALAERGRGLIRNMDGQGNKAIALKLCRNVSLHGFTIFRGGHFALLMSGVDNLTIDDLRIDTNRDGINMDCCRNVRVSNCLVNSPNDDAIVLKSSYGLGFVRATENVAITNCQLSGYDLGTLLDGTFLHTQAAAPDGDRPTGRIKLGTESNGGFRNIAIANCTFAHCRGLALETVDGGILEDVVITNITMRDVGTAPLFLRLGNRGRGPERPPVGALRRVHIAHVNAFDVDPRYAALISGIPGHPIEDVTLDDIRIVYRGGGSAEDAARVPSERENAYPEPSMFGTLPAYGLFARHVKGLTLRDIHIRSATQDLRPAMIVQQANGVELTHVQAATSPSVPVLVLKNVEDFSSLGSSGVPDQQHANVADGKY